MLNPLDGPWAHGYIEEKANMWRPKIKREIIPKTITSYELTTSLSHWFLLLAPQSSPSASAHCRRCHRHRRLPGKFFSLVEDMVGWQMRVRSLIRQVGKRVENYSTSSFSPCHFLKLQTPPSQTMSRPLYHYFQQLGISSSRNLLADLSAGVTPLSASDGEKGEERDQKSPSGPSQVQFVLKGINQSPNKVNLVAKLVRGMRVEDALLQLQVTEKQAAKTVHQALHSARADATYNHGLDPERLLVAGALVGKGFVGFRKNRLYYHGKSNDGTKVRPNYQLTVMLREIAPEEEEEITKQRVNNFLYLKKRLRLTKQENKFVSHYLTSNHKGKGSTSQPSGLAS